MLEIRIIEDEELLDFIVKGWTEIQGLNEEEAKKVYEEFKDKSYKELLEEADFVEELLYDK